VKINTIISLLILMIAENCLASGTLLDWSEGSGATLSGWTWELDPGQQGYSTLYGWSEDDGLMQSSSWFGRYIQKRDYYISDSDAPLAQISTTTIDPEGDRTLNVYEHGAVGDYGGPGWFFLPKVNAGSAGISTVSDNRMGFYVYLDGMDAWDTDDPATATMHIGTYAGWDPGVAGNTKPEYDESDASVPSSWSSYVSTNGGVLQAGHHYYHYVSIPGGFWVHVQLDQHPTHARQAAGAGMPVNNPINYFYSSDGLSYLHQLSKFYIEIRYAQSQESQYYLGPVRIYQSSESENEESITTLSCGYNSSNGKWFLSWHDMSFYHLSPYYGYGNPTQSTFEVRWSTSPITNANYSSATVAEPEYYERGTSNTFTRQNTWKTIAWDQFDLPAGTEASAQKIYWAVKDVSSVSNGDGRDNSDIDGGTLIKTIDYTLSTTPSTPTIAGSISSGCQTQ
jgi:hypothetical protein